MCNVMDLSTESSRLAESGTNWLGVVPNDWKISKIGTLYTLRSEKVSDRDYQPLSVTMQGVVPQLENAAKTNAHDDRKLVKKGDFAINSRSDRRGSCGISSLDGSVSLINTVLTPRGEMNPGYYNWLFHTVQFADEYYKWGHGIVNDLWTTRWQEMKKIAVPCPPIDEQERISSYLDKKVGRIDELISETKQSVEEYREWKIALIEKYTLGCNLDCKKQKTGLEWIAEIPEGWKVYRLKNLFDFGKGLPITKDDLKSNGVPVISYGQIHAKNNPGTRLEQDLMRYVDEKYLEENPQSLVRKGDMLVADTSEDEEGCGNAVYVDREMQLFAGYHTILLKSKMSQDNKYLAYLFMTDAWRSQIRSRVSGVKLFSISKKILNQTYVVLPPKDEQKRISEYLDVRCNQIDQIIDEKSLLVEELEEYKKSIIFETVTGKREVV